MQTRLELPCAVGNVSDGYHTFNELYDHRMVLFVHLMNSNPDISWKSRKHAEGDMFEGGWFVAGMKLPTGDITYHLEEKFWDMTNVQAFELAPKWDGHTAADVYTRLTTWEHETV